jgi:AraC family transcriptional regulator
MRDATAEDYQHRILKVLVHIQNNLDKPFSLDELASVASFSPYHFHRIFRGMVGESVKEHVRRLRLERAAHRLRFTGQPVTEIAFDAGYETHESFTRAFGAMFGEPPAEFRNNHRVVAHGSAPSGVHYASDGSVDAFRTPQSGDNPIAVRLEALPAMRVAFARHVGPYDEVGAAWQRLMSWAGRSGLLAFTTQMVGIIHDDPEVTPPDKMRYDAAIPVDDRVKPDKDIGIQQLDSGRYAIGTHRGPYNRIGDTYARLCGEWLPGSGRELSAAPALEFYRNSLMTAAPEDLITDIYLPIAT